VTQNVNHGNLQYVIRCGKTLHIFQFFINPNNAQLICFNP